MTQIILVQVSRESVLDDEFADDPGKRPFKVIDEYYFPGGIIRLMIYHADKINWPMVDSGVIAIAANYGIHAATIRRNYKERKSPARKANPLQKRLFE